MAICTGTWRSGSSRTLLMVVFVGLYSGCWLPETAAQQPVQPYCSSLDGLIEHILSSMQSMPATAVICAKIPGCTGIRCSINALGQNIGISLRMYPCASPPQMRIRIFIPSSGINFSQMITHGTTIALPGFQYSPLPGIRVQAEISVHFQKVPEGLLLGLWFQARGFGTGIRWPIVPDYTIVFPPCTTGEPATPPPPQSQCGKMELLIANLPPPAGFTCIVFPDCLGFHCFGSVDAVILKYSVNVSLTINHCDLPVSYTVALTNPGSPLLWQHTFYSNSTVPVLVNFPGRTRVNLQVLMHHSDPQGYIQTSIKVIICVTSVGCFDMYFMNSEQVPVPPCTVNAPLPILAYLQDRPARQITTPECLAWRRVEGSLMNMNIPGLRVSHCYIESPICNHIMCTAEYNGQTPPATSTSYSIYAEVKHCTQPMMMLISVRGLNNNFQMERRINADTNVTLNKNGVLLDIHFKELNGAIQLSVGVLIPLPGRTTPLELPLIENQFIPLPTCRGGGDGRGGGYDTGANQPFYPTHIPPWIPNQGPHDKTPIATDPIDEIPNEKETSKNSAVPLAIGLLFFSLVVFGGVLSYYWYRKRRTPPNESTVLVEEVEHETVRFSIGSR